MDGIFFGELGSRFGPLDRPVQGDVGIGDIDVPGDIDVDPDLGDITDEPYTELRQRFKQGDACDLAVRVWPLAQRTGEPTGFRFGAPSPVIMVRCNEYPQEGSEELFPGRTVHCVFFIEPTQEEQEKLRALWSNAKTKEERSKAYWASHELVTRKIRENPTHKPELQGFQRENPHIMTWVAPLPETDYHAAIVTLETPGVNLDMKK